MAKAKAWHHSGRAGLGIVAVFLLMIVPATGCREDLHKAALKGDIATVRRLLDGGADIDAQNSDSFTPLHLAALGGHLAVVRLLIEKGASMEATTRNGMTPLHVAAYRGQADVAEFLLEKGANPNARGEDWTPLHLAAEESGDSAETVEVLLRYGGEVDARLDDGQTPLMCAAYRGNPEAVRVLLDAGADVSARTKGGGPP